MPISGAFLREVRIKRANSAPDVEYWQSIPSLRTVDRIAIHPRVTFFVGENGSGKSTFLEAIAIAAGFNPEGGSFGSHFATHDSHSGLSQHLTLVRGVRRPRIGFFMRAETFYNFSTWVESDPLILAGYGERIHQLSHGESFLKIVELRFGNNGLFILDEPEAALSPVRQLAFLAQIHRLCERGAQFIIATHSPILMAYPNARILHFSEQGVLPVAYEDTDHYLVSRRFFTHREAVMGELMVEEEA